MRREEFSEIRHRLGKSQRQMAQLLGTSLKAVQSFEQGWRKVPIHVERQALFLLAMKASQKERRPCWKVRTCPSELRESCPAWEFNSGHLCWFISGTVCQGEAQESWRKKMAICRECGVFREMVAL
ncbi:MAG: transcriptional regulator [Proteobacteria bacterium]|nr:transcriptional regulator [Pseudomonadota bacterium]NIS70022.1 transcriptional regulator [Pseudomonadota bacterium]